MLVTNIYYNRREIFSKSFHSRVETDNFSVSKSEWLKIAYTRRILGFSSVNIVCSREMFINEKKTTQ